MTTPRAPSTPDRTPGRKIAAGAVAMAIVACGGAAIWAASTDGETGGQGALPRTG